MRSNLAPKRAIITAGTVAAVLTTALSFGAAPASAHVHVDADGAAPGSTSILTFRVPNESEKGALTTQLSVNLPNVASAMTETLPGWTARLDRDGAAGTVRSVTWTANPDVGIPPDQFGLFRVSVKLPNATSVSLPAVQTYSDGTVVKWDEPTPPNGAEPEHPAPVLTLGSGPGQQSPSHDMTSSAQASPPPAAAAPAVSGAWSDDTARWLGGAALILAAVGIVAALVRGRRT
jgi:uncharacterized protein YcnI